MSFPPLRGICALFLLLCVPFSLQAAETYRLGIAPVLDFDETIEVYQPMVDYLSEKTGVKFELVPSQNFIGYWNQMRKEDAYDFLFDGAHLSAWRVAKMEHRLVARVSGVLSFTLISRADDLYLEPDELVHRKVAVLASPNVGGLQVYNLFTNPSRQPQMVEVRNAVDALEAVRDGRADAAYVPTPILSRYPEATVITTSEPMPNMSLTASPRVPLEVGERVASALLEAGESEVGREMLAAINVNAFEAADKREYAGLEKLLHGMWGY